MEGGGFNKELWKQTEIIQGLQEFYYTLPYQTRNITKDFCSLIRVIGLHCLFNGSVHFLIYIVDVIVRLEMHFDSSVFTVQRHLPLDGEAYGNVVSGPNLLSPYISVRPRTL